MDSAAGLSEHDAQITAAINSRLSGNSQPSSAPPLHRLPAGRLASQALAAPILAPPSSGPAARPFNLSHLLLNLDAPFGTNSYPAPQVRGRFHDADIQNLYLKANTRYRLVTVAPELGWIFSSDFTSGPIGSITTIPLSPALTDPQLPVLDVSDDTDGDGLGDDTEFVLGTARKKADTDGDGISDGAEVAQGTDPLSGLAVRTGIVASTPVPGVAFDVTALNDLVATADLAQGVSIFNVYGGLKPTLIAQVPTPAPARAVAISGNLIAVAADTAGLVVIDATDPAAAKIITKVDLAGPAQAVAAAGNLAIAGTASGDVVIVDMVDGSVRDRASVTEPIQDLGLAGNILYLLTVGRLYAYPILGGQFSAPVPVDSPGVIGAGGKRLRLTVAGSRAYAMHTQGYIVFDLADPAHPVLLAHLTHPEFGWKQIVPNGAGLALAAVGNNSTDDGPHDVRLYNIGTQGTNDLQQALFVTPGLAYAVALYNGLAYVADGAAGLEVINYLPFDTAGRPPTVALHADFGLNPAQVEEGKQARIWADVTDDVQVRNVEFYVDGAKVETDGSYPFEHRFVTPTITANKTTFTVRAKATDTGGNSAWTDEVTVALGPDRTAPQIVRVSPDDGRVLGESTWVSVVFSEPIQVGTLDNGRWQLYATGPDGKVGTADDVPVPGTITYAAENNTAYLSFDRPLASDVYRAVLLPGVTDLAGNPSTNSLAWSFRVFVADLSAGPTPTLSGTVDGRLDQDVFTIQAVAGQRAYFDAQSGDNCAPRLRWKLLGSDGGIVFDQVFAARDVCGPRDPGTVTLTNSGIYTLTIYSSGPVGDTYQFQVWNVVDQNFPIQVGDVITNGIPALGAGNIETPGTTDRYSFQAAAGQTIYFDAQSGDNCATPLRWKCTNPSGALLFDQVFATRDVCGPHDPGSMTLTNAGTYTITVYAAEDGVGTFEFQLWDVIPQHFAIAVGGVVSTNVPDSGAGVIETPGAQDIYTFQATAGQTIYFDAQSGDSCGTPLRWKCSDSTGAQLFNQVFATKDVCGPHDPGTITLTNGGTYTITVYAAEDGVGGYQFQLWNVAPEHFAIAIGDVVSTNAPSSGAGAIETPGAQDIYTFQGAAGQTIYFDAQSGDSCGTPLRWKCSDSTGAQLFNQVFATKDVCGPHDPGTITLTNGGTYTITVYAAEDGVGGYQFQLWNVAPEHFAIAIGDVVSTNAPSSGAGVIETPGAQDIYTFQGAAGQTIYFDAQSGDSCGTPLRWKCTDSTGAQLFNQVFATKDVCGPHDPGTITLTNGGTYTITVYATEDGVGGYQFQLWNVAPEHFAIAIGDVVSTNAPSSGAGIIETPGAQDVYTFQAAPGQTVYFDAQSGTNCGGGIHWRCTSSAGAQVFDQVFATEGPCGPTDPGAITLSAGGLYTITVYGVEEAIGTYQFQIRNQLPP